MGGTQAERAQAEEVFELSLQALQSATGLALGAPGRPLILAVRASPSRSLPGALPTLLDVGIDQAVADALRDREPRFCRDLRVRALLGVAEHVLGLRARELEGGARPPGQGDTSAQVEQRLERLEMRVSEARLRWAELDARAQLRVALEAVVESVSGQRFASVLDAHGQTHSASCAVVVQRMVFGNRSGRDVSGVASSRDPRTGGSGPVGEYLPCSQGSDLVGGRQRGIPFRGDGSRGPGLDTVAGEASQELALASGRIEARVGRPVQIEFTVEDGRLWLLQCRPESMSPQGAVKAALALRDEGVVDDGGALASLPAEAYEGQMRARLPAPGALTKRGIEPVLQGLGASPGVASGTLVLDADGLARAIARGAPAVLVRAEATPDDVPSLRQSEALLTCSGGLTSHAAVIARGLGLCCVVGCESVLPDPKRGGLGSVTTPDGPLVLREGEQVTLDGARGLVYRGHVPWVHEPSFSALGVLLEWARAQRSGTLWLQHQGAAPGQGSADLGADMCVRRCLPGGDLSGAGGEREVLRFEGPWQVEDIREALVTRVPAGAILDERVFAEGGGAFADFLDLKVGPRVFVRSVTGDLLPDLPRGIRPVLGPGRAALGPTGQSSGATEPGGGPIQAGAAIELPGVGGIDLARRLVELWGPVPDVVFISGSSCIGRDAVLLAQADVGGSGGR